MLIGFADKEALFCGSTNLIDVFSSPTSFCTFSGESYIKIYSFYNTQNEMIYEYIILIYLANVMDVAGIVYYYILVQTFMWMTFLALTLCWNVVFPVHYNKLKEGKKLMIYLHIATVILGIAIPLITSLVHLKDGYTIISRPTVTCNPQNVDYIFYGFVLPISILLSIATSALFLVVYTLLKVYTHDYSII